MKRFLACFLIAIPFTAFSAIRMECISVGSGGDATISWLNTSSSVLFRSYHIFHSINGTGPFSLVDSINVFATQTFVHLTANANAANAFYYVELKNTNGTTVTGDTISAIRLSVIDQMLGYASLQWNTSHNPPIATNSDYYLIYKEYPAGLFTLLDSVDVTVSPLSYLDEITVCGDSLNYRLEVTDASGCISVSSVDGDFCTDRIAPSAPHLDSVSMDASGNAVMSWSQSTSGDTYGYIIYQADDSNAIAIDTVIGIGTTFYQSGISALLEAQGFRVLAIDTCGNPCAADPLQRTLLLQGTLDRCAGVIQLSWNPYVNTPSAPLYKIIMNVNGGADVLLATTGLTSFSVTGLKTDTFYCFRVLAELNGAMATSTSNPVCITPDLPVAPQYSYIRTVTVFPNDVVSIMAHVDPLADLKEYRLQRSASATGNFVTVQTQPYTGISPIEFTDAVSTAMVSYYRVASIDSCGNDAYPSQVCRTVSLDTGSTENFQNSLSWNSYQQWPSGTSHYLIYRSVDGIYDPSPIAVIPGSDSAIADDVNELFSSEGDFCYYVVAYESPGNPFGFADSARSNEVCTKQKSGVYIPNAFRPEGVNSVFNPAESYTGLEGYSLEIYNRFGERIFETNDSAVGWNGSAKSHQCQTGVYVYHFKARNEKGLAVEKIGRVTLIR
jgi:gliding motility-associated-like protein